MNDVQIDQDPFVWPFPFQGLVPDPLLPTELLTHWTTISTADNSSRLEKLLSVADVVRVMKLSRATVYRLIADEKFPAGYRVAGLRQRRWKESEVAAWLDANIKPIE